MHDPHDTIVAIASAAGGAVRGIIRVSGPGTIECVAALCCEAADSEMRSLDRPARVVASLSVDGFTAAVPCSLVVWPTARSYTRQPSVEIHTAGSPPILQAMLRTLCRHGVRPAAPGEFTLRAFLAGRLDLTQAEAVLGVIESRDRHELDVAITQLAGGLGTPLVQLRDALLELLAHLEAGLDFVEEDIEFIAREELRRQIAAAAAQVQTLVERTTTRAVLRDAVRVVLVGSPNVGKSSLFNALLHRSAALVSPLAGTTRDYLVGEVVIGGAHLVLVDTAGVEVSTARDSEGLATLANHDVAAAAQSATTRERRCATVELLCLDTTRPLNSWERAQLAGAGGRVVALTKSDQPRELPAIDGAVTTSSETGAGLDELGDRLSDTALASGGDSSDVVAVTAARCHESLRAAAVALREAVSMIDDRAGEELVAAELRAAIDDLGQVVGAVYTEDLLDLIFSRFCIGK